MDPAKRREKRRKQLQNPHTAVHRILLIGQGEEGARGVCRTGQGQGKRSGKEERARGPVESEMEER